MKNEITSFVSSRRDFLKNILPAGTLFCFTSSRLSALACDPATQKATEAKHKFLEDPGLTMREVFRFAYMWTYIPMMQALATQLGREKLIGLVKEATGAYWAELTRSYAQKLPKKDLAAFFRIDPLEAIIDNKEHRESFWSLANTTQTIESTAESYEMKVTECLWAQTFREANEGDLGFASICYADEAMAAAFDPRLKLIRTKALMKGDDCCHFRWVWEG
jgi:hypothetical protein